MATTDLVKNKVRADLETKLFEFDQMFEKYLTPWEKATYRKIVNLYIISSYGELTEEGKKTLQHDIESLERRFKRHV